MWQYRAQLSRCVDGDTLDVTVDLGFGVMITQRIRLVGVNAPERNTPEGVTAKRWVEAWLADLPKDGFPLTLTSKKPHVNDKYGRYLCDVVRHDGLNLSECLIKAGMAKPFMVDR